MMPENSPIISVRNTRGFLLRSVLGWTGALLLGVTGLLAAKFLSLPNLPAMLITMGAFGLAGGLWHAFLIRSAGGKVTWIPTLLLSFVWTLSIIGGALPLFYTSGTLLEMAVRTFYSFAFFGAIGGTATAWVMKTLFDKASDRDVVPCVLTWSFSFGLAAAACDTAGEGLQMLLPVVMAWSAALGVMALIMGGGGGYSVVQFLRAGKSRWRALERSAITATARSDKRNKRHIVALALLTIPFYLNDFSNIFIPDWRLWLLIDYIGVKLYPFIVMLWLFRTNTLEPFALGLTAQPAISFVTVFVIGMLTALFIEHNGNLILMKVPGYLPLGGMPEIKSPLWIWIDLTAGLVMVAIFEELVFRGYLHTFISLYTRRPLIIVAVSAVAFGCIHWSGGLHKILITSTIGAVFMLLYLRTGSLPAIMSAHFVVNFIDLSNAIPKSIFKFF